METKLTFEEYNRVINKIDEDIMRLGQQRVYTIKLYIKDNRKFQDGDIVHIWAGTPEIYKGLFCIKKATGINYGGDVAYQISKLKKDGTPSEQSAGIYYFTRMEKA